MRANESYLIQLLTLC